MHTLTSILTIMAILIVMGVAWVIMEEVKKYIKK